MARSKHPYRQMHRNIILYAQNELFGCPLNELATQYGISYERARQIVRNVYWRIQHGDDEYVEYFDKLFK